MVGDPFSGKTTVLEVLAETLNLLTDRGYDDESVNKVLNSNKLDGTNWAALTKIDLPKQFLLSSWNSVFWFLIFFIIFATLLTYDDWV